MKRLAYLMILVLASVISYGQAAKDLSAKDFKHLTDSIPGAVIIDLRTPDELTKGAIPGAIHIDFFDKDFETKIGNLDPAKPYFLYCAGGGRSGQTVELMGNKGFKQVYHLSGGFDGWKRAGLPVNAHKRK